MKVNINSKMNLFIKFIIIYLKTKNILILILQSCFIYYK